MEGLIELVAASLVRHGIECPAGDSKFISGHSQSPVQTSMSPTEPTALLEHSFRKKSEGDAAP
jgi:hypothetical protein